MVVVHAYEVSLRASKKREQELQEKNDAAQRDSQEKDKSTLNWMMLFMTWRRKWLLANTIMNSKKNSWKNCNKIVRNCFQNGSCDVLCLS